MEMLHLNLIEKYNDRKAQMIERLKADDTDFTDVHPVFKVGDVIEFTAGYNNNIRYTTSILGFTKNFTDKGEAEIYVLWDCFWLPIRNDKARNIILK